MQQIFGKNLVLDFTYIWQGSAAKIRKGPAALHNVSLALDVNINFYSISFHPHLEIAQRL